MVKIQVIENSDNRKVVYYRNVKSKSSKYKGVYLKKWAKNMKWAVKLSLKNKLYHIDSYEDELEAGVAYDYAASLLIGKKAYKNSDSNPELVGIFLNDNQIQRIKQRISIITSSLSKLNNEL